MCDGSFGSSVEVVSVVQQCFAVEAVGKKIYQIEKDIIMLFDFERLYIYRRRRRFLAPVDILIVLPKEVDIPSMKQFWLDQGAAKFDGNFIKYVEWFGGRRAEAEDEIAIIDLADIRDAQEATRRWLERGVNTARIGVKEFVPMEKTIEENIKQIRIG